MVRGARGYLFIFALIVSAFCLLCVPATAQKSDVTAIVGAQLLDGNGGPPVHRSLVIIQGKKISYVGREGDPIPGGAKIVDAHGMSVTPGLVEMHAHLIILGTGDYFQWFPWAEREKRAMEIMKISAKQLLMQGVTTVRDEMSPTEESISLRDDINAGKFDGPRLFVTGNFIARNCWMLSTYYCTTIHSPEEAREEAKKRIASGVDWVKAWVGVNGDDLKVIADEAHKAGKKVSTHGTTVEEITNSINAPVDSIEHTGGGAWGSIPPELLERLAQSQVWVVPTMMQGWVYKLTEDFPERIDDPQLKKDFPPDIYKIVHDSDEHPERLQYYFGDIHNRINVMPENWSKMVHSGIAHHIVLGTDTGTPLNWNTNATRNELILLVKAGMTPLEALSAGTRLGAQALGKLDDFGTIVPGKSADILVIDGNPLEDMAYMKNVVHIFKEGKQYK